MTATCEDSRTAAHPAAATEGQRLPVRGFVPRRPVEVSPPKQPRHATYADQPVLSSDYEMTPGLRAALVDAGVDPAAMFRASGIRGRFATGTLLAAAIFGPDGTNPARTRGQVRYRLGMSNGGAQAAARLKAAADFYDLTLPGTGARDGAAPGASVLDDDVLVMAAHATSHSLADMCRRLNLSPTAKTYERIRGRLLALGLSDLTQPVGPIRSS